MKPMIKALLTLLFVATASSANAQPRLYRCGLMDYSGAGYLRSTLKIPTLTLVTELRPSLGTVTPYAEVTLEGGTYRFRQRDFKEWLFSATSGNYFSVRTSAGATIGLDYLILDNALLAGQNGTLELRYIRAANDPVYQASYDCRLERRR